MIESLPKDIQEKVREWLSDPYDAATQNEVQSLLKKVKNTRSIQSKNRIKKNIVIVSIVGYTNAGKSTLFNAFPNKKTKSENRLFSTLDPY
mgnify:CR=1 FL=1